MGGATYHLRSDDDGTPRALYRVTDGWPVRWQPFDWEDLEADARDRVMRQVYLGPEDLDAVPPDGVAAVQAALRWREERRLLAWRFRAAGGLEAVEARLAPLGRPWSPLDAQEDPATRGVVLAPGAHLAFWAQGEVLTARLTVAGRSAPEVEAKRGAWASEVQGRVLPLAGASEVLPTPAHGPGGEPRSLAAELAAQLDILLELPEADPAGVGTAVGAPLRRVASGGGLGRGGPGEADVEDFVGQLPVGPFGSVALQNDPGSGRTRLALRVREGSAVYRGDLRPGRFGPERQDLPAGAPRGWTAQQVGRVALRCAYEPASRQLRVVVLDGRWPTAG
jgi:hypothetical protein